MKVLAVITNLLVYSFLTATPHKETVVFTYNNARATKPIGHFLHYFIDHDNKVTTPKDIPDSAFKQGTQNAPNLGFVKSNVWVKISIQNNNQEDELYLEVARPNIDEIEFFDIEDNTSVKSGKHFPFNSRSLKYPNYIFPLNIKPNKSKKYFLKINSSRQIILPVYIKSKEQVYTSKHKKDIIYGMYFGIILIMALYNTFLYISIKDSSYLYYVLYTLSVGLAQASEEGYTFQYFWPNSLWFAKQSIIFFGFLIGLFAILFVKKFLNLNQNSPILSQLFNIPLLGFVLMLALNITSLHHLSNQVMQVMMSLTSSYIILVAFVAYYKNYKPAKFFLMSWLTLLVGVIIYMLKDAGFLPHNVLTNSAIQIGSAIEVTLLSLALGKRINIMRWDTQKAQQEKQKALEKQLKTAQTLDQTQSELIKTARMASIGRTVARIAHELNTPIYNARTTAQHVTTQTKELLEHIPSDTKVKLEEYQNNIEKMSSGLMTSINRAAKLISNFRQTSADQTSIQKKYFKLKDYINTVIISHEIMLHKKQIKVNLTGINPIIYTDPGLIYQLIQNLITNTEKYGYPDGNGTININITKTDTEFIITYKDYGKGIPKKILPHIFKPFYTTGEDKGGIGLGLPIIHSVVTEHLQGNITCDSIEGDGVMFTVTLNKKTLQ